VVIDYPNKPKMLPQAACYYGTGYDDKIAPARTYGFVSELEYLAAHGLAMGASKENAFALTDDGAPSEDTPLRFENEAARHKLLDLIGDLALLGRPLQAGIVASRPSHTLNSMLSRELVKLLGCDV
jgi:UDP-3-O-[3-hydroxymyristoyl] N-acetylglucosamine deacetylase